MTWETLARKVALIAGTLTCVALLAHATDGFRVFTAEQARRLGVAETPVLVPDIWLRDQWARRLPLRPRDGRVEAVTFIYTRCGAVCAASGDAMARLDQRLRALGLEGRVRLLNLSFDPANDHFGALADYATAHGADGEAWRVAVAEPADALPTVLSTFGVTVLPDGQGGFVHNAALHLVASDGRLFAILDLDDLDRAVALLGAAR